MNQESQPLDDPLSQHLKDQITFLRNSCKLFDDGIESEAIRLAIIARVLLHDTHTSHSLFGQMGKKEGLFLSSARPLDPRNLIPHHGILQVRLGSTGSSYRVPLDDRPSDVLHWLNFNEWWAEIVFADLRGNQLARSDIILELANKKGGAHVDPELSDSYKAIAKDFSFWRTRNEFGEFPLEGNVVRLAMRQIAHELMRTLDNITYSFD
jgi:hypothetical protein